MSKNIHPLTVAPTMTATHSFTRVTPQPAYDMLPFAVPTSSELEIHGNNKGTDVISPHVIERSSDLHSSCVEPPIDLATPYALEDIIVHLNLSCDQILEKLAVLTFECS